MTVRELKDWSWIRKYGTGWGLWFKLLFPGNIERILEEAYLRGFEAGRIQIEVSIRKIAAEVAAQVIKDIRRGR